MFSIDELERLRSFERDYSVLISNGHDIRLLSKMSGHEWIIISPYNINSCQILHRHSYRTPFHSQRGRYDSLFLALEYIKQHDIWYYGKQRHNESQCLKKERQNSSNTPWVSNCFKV